MPRIVHFTDGANLRLIVADRRLRAHRQAQCAVDVGDALIKSRRASIAVPCGPGGVVGDYVPFYFTSRSPMLFSIKSGNVEGVSSDQRRLVYLVSSTEAAYDAGCACVFTDGNAATAFTSFEDAPGSLATHVDWPLMRERYWLSTQEDPDRRRRRMAEFLVHGALPLSLVAEVVVHDEAVRTRVASIMGSSFRIVVRPDWYF